MYFYTFIGVNPISLQVHHQNCSLSLSYCNMLHPPIATWIHNTTVFMGRMWNYKEFYKYDLVLIAEYSIGTSVYELANKIVL
jgi:hypothetical protein